MNVPRPSSLPRLWRQGDILIQECRALPKGCQPRKSPLIARGEATGHSHRVTGPRTAILHDPPGPERFTTPGLLYLQVSGEAGCTITHAEHGPVPLEPGCYRIWRQREFDPVRGVPRMAGD